MRKKDAGFSAKKRTSYSRRRELYGYGFISLWLVGTLLFFIIPLVRSVRYSFSSVAIEPGRLNISFVGFKNYVDALTKDPEYTECLKASLAEALWKTPLIIIFSLFIAVILNQRFRGRAIARAIFFLPVIIVTGPVFRIISGDMKMSGSTGAEQFSTMFSTNLVGELMEFLGIYSRGDALERYISTVADNIFGIVWSSGVQILLFLAALQHIPASAREAAQIEGATSWEYFWKITFPYVGPFILANLIYTVIDTFTSPMNTVMRRILTLQSADINYGLASAMAWIYFAAVMVMIGVISAVAGKFIFYENDK